MKVMITLQGLAPVVELIAGALFIVGLVGFSISRAKPWIFISAMAFVVVLVAAVTIIVDSSA
jgi:hypothetical protein